MADRTLDGHVAYTLFRETGNTKLGRIVQIAETNASKYALLGPSNDSVTQPLVSCM